jgi:hypothetical protein
MFVRSERGGRRFTAATYRCVITAHVGVSVAWLGVVLAKFALAIMAMAPSEPQAAQALYFAMESLNVVFPPLVVASLLTGVALSLGTRWGLLEYYWVLTKFVLSFVVFVSGARFSSVLAQGSIAARTGVSLPDDTLLEWAASPSTLLAVLFALHLLGLAVATVLSQYKPWGTMPRLLRGVGRARNASAIR